MNIDVPLKELGSQPIDALRDRILSFDDARWLGNDYRQNTYDVHKYTQSIVMIFTDGSGWPNFTVEHEDGYDDLADVALPLMQSILEQHYPPGGKIIRAMAAKLVSGGIISPHVDKHPTFHFGHRIHVPITTNPRVRFMIDGRPYQFEVGNAYEINNQKQHSVMNRGKEDRITFIFDYVPPHKLEELEQLKQRHTTA